LFFVLDVVLRVCVVVVCFSDVEVYMFGVDGYIIYFGAGPNTYSTSWPFVKPNNSF